MSLKAIKFHFAHNSNRDRDSYCYDNCRKHPYPNHLLLLKCCFVKSDRRYSHRFAPGCQGPRRPRPPRCTRASYRACQSVSSLLTGRRPHEHCCAIPQVYTDSTRRSCTNTNRALLTRTLSSVTYRVQVDSWLSSDFDLVQREFIDERLRNSPRFLLFVGTLLPDGLPSFRTCDQIGADSRAKAIHVNQSA